MKKHIGMLVAILCLACVGSSVGALLIDPGFEANDPAVGWGFLIGAGLVAETGPNSAPGDGISMELTPPGVSGYAQIIAKAVPIASGQLFDLALDYKQLAGGSGNIVMQARYYAGVGANGFSDGGGGTLLGQNTFTLPASIGAWSTYGTGPLPNNWPTADYVEIRIIGNAFGVPQQGSTRVDNVLLKWAGSVDPAMIVDGSVVSSNVIKLVVGTPGAANNDYPKFREDLMSGDWAGTAHSDDGAHPFVVTNLDYSTTDATGTNKVVYVHVDTKTGFFRMGKVAGLFKAVKTLFQTNEFYDPREALAVDGVLIHRHGVWYSDLASHISSWEGGGRTVGRMFFSDSDAGTAYTSGAWDGTNHSSDIETDQNGNPLLAGTRPYMVPTPGWTGYLQEMTGNSLLAGAASIFPEEPLAHAYSGYSPSFQQLWVQHYGFAWQAQHSSAKARFLTAQLKGNLYLDLEASLMQTTRTFGGAVVADPAFVIPIHSIYGNIAAQLVAPLGASAQIDCDGYIGQIWTGPINWSLAQYASTEKSFFSSAYALYDYFTQLSVGTGKKLWLLVDPVEDDPNHTWTQYMDWYRHSVAAMLMMPEVDSYEVMPWPERIFLPGFGTGGGSPAPVDFRKTALAITQALQEMPLGGQWSMMASDEATPGIAVAIADSAMWMENQANMLQGTYGQLLPLVERGVPVSACVLERAADVSYMDNHKVIVVSYEDFKPVEEAMNTALAAWVQRGGVLVLLGNSNDALDNDSSFWWRQLGYATPMAHLLALVGGTGAGDWGFGNGYVIRNTTSPSAFANPSTATSVYLPLIDLAIQHTASGGNLSTPGYFMMRRGPFVIAHARQQAVSKAGKFVDIFDPALPVLNGISLSAGESGLFRDVTPILAGSGVPQVLHATHRLVSQQFIGDQLRFAVRGPTETPAVVRLFLGGRDILGTTATNSAGQAVLVALATEGNTARLEFPNDPGGVDVVLQMGVRTLPPVVTGATVVATGTIGVEGVNGDAFDGVSITAHSPLLVLGMGEDPNDWFTSPNAGETLFDDPPGTKFIEFNSAIPLILTNIIVRVSADLVDPGDENRSVSNIRLYASTTASPMWSAGNLVFDIALDPDYSVAYGSHLIGVGIDLSSVEGRYFRLEFEQPYAGARIREIDAFGE